MPIIFGRGYAKDELRRLVGGMSQLAGIRLVDLADGRVRGMRAAEVFTGSGLRFQVLVDRGLDLEVGDGAAGHVGTGQPGEVIDLITQLLCIDDAE